MFDFTHRLKLAMGLLCCFAMLSSAVPAMAASVETLLMPGPLSEAHAELESDCSECHTNFDQGAQDELCLGCHEEVAEDITLGMGFHTRNPAVAQGHCSGCHIDHKGRDADITGMMPELFDHRHTDFPLKGMHAQAVCSECHTPGEAFRETPQSCVACHDQDNPHPTQMENQAGDDCAGCHSEESWQIIAFDHAGQTGFALDGGHGALDCKACHKGGVFTDVSTQCVSCHALDDVHNGGRGEDCAGCHNEQKWAETSFDHDALTEFPLRGGHKDLSCVSCHLTGMSLEAPPVTCVGCHGANDPHQGRNGDACEGCHSNTSWTLSFDHATQTGFALQGAHNALDCDSCHRGALDDPLETACYACHVDDDPHGGSLTTCDECHGQNNWLTEVSFHHDLTTFPLLGSHKLTSCEQCHNGLQFSVTPGQACIDCHENDNPHGRSLGGDCSVCHSPVAWSLWNFDHDQQTTFQLAGAHQALTCPACHEISTAAQPPATCRGCHRQDDPHQGTFGTDCQRCHNQESFSNPFIRRGSDNEQSP